jgi:hypothetical protein
MPAFRCNPDDRPFQKGKRMNITRHCKTFVRIAALLLAMPAMAGADSATEVRIPQRLEPGFAHLLSVVDNRQNIPFDPERVAPILEFILTDKAPGVRYNPGKMGSSTSAYHDFTLALPLEDFLRLAYNPRLPSHLTVPSTVRLSYWSSIGGEPRPLPQLWRHLDSLDTPFRVDGVEFVVNTPDLFSGAYYGYELDRTMILFTWNKMRVMLSLSKQRGRSTVGKKGAVLGPDKQWNYLYTDQEGLSRTGLGWVDSYMYDSFSITAYVETAGDNPGVRCGIFKWLDAGWAGINVVRPSHIYRGLVRFGDDFKAVVEAPQLADAEGLQQAMHRVESLSDETLRQKTADYFRRLHDRYGAENRLLEQWYENAFGESGHLARLSRREMEARICIEVLKSMMGKESRPETGKSLAGID